MMKRFLAVILIIFVHILTLTVDDGHAVQPPAVGGRLPDFELSLPDDKGDMAYLGLNCYKQCIDRGVFRVPQMGAQVVVLQIFSMYCPHCQEEAPNVNALFRLIANNPATKGNIRIIGVGVGNTSYEVSLYRKRYQIPFPLFPDEEFTIHEKLGDVRIPYFIVIRIQPDGTHRVVYSRVASFGDPEKFLASIIKLVDLEIGGEL